MLALTLFVSAQVDANAIHLLLSVRSFFIVSRQHLPPLDQVAG